MMEMINAIAVRVLETWLLSVGFYPSGGWDEHDLNCLRQHGPHLVWTVCGRISVPVKELDKEALWRSFEVYCHSRNNLPTAVRFEPYDLQLYECPCGCGTYLYASIYQ